MKTKLYVALLALVLVGLYLVNSKSQAASTVTWEYKIESKCSDEKKLNALGAEGWELTGFAISESGLGGNWRCVFKRAK